jgi:hypothetical protein
LLVFLLSEDFFEILLSAFPEFFLLLFVTTAAAFSRTSLAVGFTMEAFCCAALALFGFATAFLCADFCSMSGLTAFFLAFFLGGESSCLKF